MTGNASRLLHDALQTLAADPTSRIFGVIDGALIPDLPSKLDKAGLWHRSLLREGASNDLVIAGPRLVDLAKVAERTEALSVQAEPNEDLSDETLARMADDIAAKARMAFEGGDEAPFDETPQREWRPTDASAGLATIFEVTGGKEAVVFWCGDHGLSEDRIYAHLRGLGKIRIPTAAKSDSGSAQTAGEGELVVFRHADPSVLAQVLPVLDAHQQARLLGPAEAVIFLPAEEWQDPASSSTLKRLRRPEAGTSVAPGPLAIRPDQYAAMRAKRLERSRLRLMRYLRESAPDETAQLSDEALYAHISKAERSGLNLGLRSEAAQGQWAYLVLASDGTVETSNEIRTAIADARDPDAAITALMREMARQAEVDVRLPATGRG